MTKLKRLVAVALSVLMILGSLSMSVYALNVDDFDGSTLTISTKIFREVNGEWVETEKVKQGETVKARVFLGTDYYTSSGDLLFFYDTSFFDDTYGTSKETLTINPYYSSDPYLATGNFYAPGSISAVNLENYMLNNGRLSEIVSDTDDGTEFAKDYDALSVSYSFGPKVMNQKFNVNKWFCEFTLKVKADASGTGDFLAVEKTSSTSDFSTGYINIPKGTYDSYNEDVVDMANWDVTLSFDSQPVSLYVNPVSVTFNANGGAFSDYKNTKHMEGESGSALEIQSPKKENAIFSGWQIEGTDTVVDEVTVFPTAETVYVAVWESIDSGETLTFRTEIHRLNPETGEYEKTDKVKRGEVVKARLYVDTTYFTNTGDIIVFYDNDFFTDTYANDVSLDLTVNDLVGTSAKDLGIEGTFAKATNTNNEIVEKLVNNNYISNDFVSTHTAFAIQYKYATNQGGAKLEGDTAEDWLVEFELQVLSTATGEGDFFIVPATIQNPDDGYYAHINVPLSTDGGKAVDVVPMYQWEVNAGVTSNPVTIESSIKLNAAGGTFAENGTDTYLIEGYVGDTTVAPEEPERDGYAFMGWIDEEGNSAEIPATMPYEDMELTAVWQEQVEITFVLNNGEADIVETVTSGQPFVAPEEPKKVGSYFRGWTDVTTSNIPKGLPEVYPDVDTTYYAVYENYNYNVYYYLLGEEGFKLIATTTAEYGEVIPATPNAQQYTVPEGYSLTTPWTDIALTTKLADGATMPTEAVKLYYKLTANTYEATFDANGGAWSDDSTTKTVTATFDSPIAAPAEEPVLKGYNFVGWNPEVGVMDEENKIFYAAWEKATFNATYIVDDEVYEEFPVEFEDEVDVPADPVKEGYKFTGWTNYTAGMTMPAEDVEFIATFEIQSYVATFDPNGGAWEVKDENGDVVVDENNNPVTDSTPKTVTTVYNEDIKVPEAPKKQGYVFGGWDPVPGAMPGEDTTYTAKWEPATNTPYTIETYTMDTKGEYSETPDPTPVTKTGTTGTTAEVTPNASVGMEVDKTKSVLSAEIAADGSTVLKIYYARVSYDIDFDACGGKFEDGSKYIDGSYRHGATVAPPTDPERTGYTFAGWKPVVVPTAVADAVYEAQWTINQYTITFDTDGGTEIGPITQNYYTEVTAPENPDKEGHIFDGWVDEKGQAADVPERMPAEDITLKATWTPDTYDANFDANGGYFVDDNGDPVVDENGDKVTTDKVPTVFDEPIELPNDPEKEGYEFGGWVDENGNPADKMDEEGKDFTAVWNPANVKYTIEYYYMTVEKTYPETPDNIDDTNVALTESTASVIPEEVENFTVDTEKSVLEAVVEPDGSTVLKVYYEREINTLTIVVDPDDATKDIVKDYPYEAPVDAVAQPSRDGYDFAGWVDKDGKPVSIPENMPAEDTTIYADWTPKKFTVIYVKDVIDNGDGTTTEVIAEAFTDVAFGSEVPAPAMPTKTGYTFGGWFDADDVQNTEYKTMPDKDLKFFAKWNSIDGVPYVFEVYEMDVEGNYPSTPTSTTTLTDGEVGKTVTVGYTAPTGFTLDDSKLTGTIVAGETLKLYAYIARNKHNFVAYYDTEKSAVVAQDEYLYNAAVAPVTAPTKDGYVFDGWVYEDNTEATIPALMPDKDVTVYATWEKNSFGATFDAGDGHFVDAEGNPIYDENGDNVTSVTVPTDFEEPITAPENKPAKDGYDFVGWAPASDPENAITDGNYGTMDKDGESFVAVWKIASYKLTFYEYVAAEGGSAPAVAKSYASTSLEYGKQITFPKAPEFEGYYEFVGWTEDEGLPIGAVNIITTDQVINMPAGDYNLYAVYKRIPVKLIPVEGSTTMVERDGVIESYNSGYTVTSDIYPKPASPENWFIYGLETRMREATLLSDFITVQGDGHIEVERVTTADGITYRQVGTGAIVRVIDNVSGECVETFYIIVYGDINGDGNANAADASIILDETVNVTSWSIEGEDDYRAYKVKAANVKKDNRINAMDSMIVKDYAVGACDIDQINGVKA